MRRIVLCISIVLGLAIAGPDAFAQEIQEALTIRTGPERTVYSIDSSSVTANKLPVALHAASRAVTIMTGEEIAAAPVQTMNDLLKYAAGVDVRQRGAFGMQTDISMRGGTYNQVAVLLNGINITDPQTGHNSFDFPVNLSDIDHIEVVEGPAARIYGTSAMVGAVNIVTKGSVNQPVESPTMGDADLYGRIWPLYENNKTITATSSYEGGSFGYYNIGGSFSQADCRDYHYASFAYSQSKGYSKCAAGTPNTDFKAAKMFYNGGHEWTNRNLTWQTGITGKFFGAGTFYSPKYDNQYEGTAKVFVAVKSEGRGLLHFTPSVYWNYGEDEFQLFRDEPDKYPYNYHKTNVAGLNINCYVDSKLGRTAFGAEARHEAIRSTNLGEKLVKPNGKYVCGLGRTAYSAFIDHKVTIGWFTLSGGVTAAYNTGNTEGIKFFPGAEVSLRLPDVIGYGSLCPYVSYNTSYRMPTFTDLYYSVGGHLADPNLKAEKMQSIEYGFKLSSKEGRIFLSEFFNKGYDMIDWVKDTSLGEDAPWTSVNHSELFTTGEECTIQLYLPQALHIDNFFIKGITLAAIHLEQKKELDENMRSMYSMEYIKNKYLAQADFRIWRHLTANVSYVYVDRATDSELIKPYHLLDAKLNYDAQDIQVYIKANNLLNRPYYDFGEVPQPGLWIVGGASFKFHFSKN